MPPPVAKKVWPTFVWGALVFCAFWLLAFAVMRLGSGFETYEEQRAKARFERLEKNNEAQLAKITSYGWVNKEQGVVHIPIQEATRLAVQDLQQKQVGPSSVPIATPVPAVAPADTAPAETGAAPAEQAPAAPSDEKLPAESAAAPPQAVDGAPAATPAPAGADAAPGSASPEATPSGARPVQAPAPTRKSGTRQAPTPATTPQENSP